MATAGQAASVAGVRWPTRTGTSRAAPALAAGTSRPRAAWAQARSDEADQRAREAMPHSGVLVFGWLRDQLGVIDSVAETEALARSVPDTAGVHFVPAFSGLFSPHWRPDARGVVVGLTAFTGRAHLVRAAVEAIGHQTADVVDAMSADADTVVSSLRVDGGITANATCMQAQADILGVPVQRAAVRESTAFGAALAAGLAAGIYRSTGEVAALARYDREWEPRWSADQRGSARSAWRDAVRRSYDLAPA